MEMIRHAKYRNTGLIFELLVRQVTADALGNKTSKAADILKEYFIKGELAKEYKMYETLVNSQTSSEHKADAIISTILEYSKKLNRNILKKKKYNLIKEIKKYYNLETFFQYRVPNYKMLASVYTLFEIKSQENFKNPDQELSNKSILLEYITKKPVSSTNSVVEEYQKLETDIQILTYRALLEKFNSKYSSLNAEQKSVLKEYITVDSSTNEFKDFINFKMNEVKSILNKLNKSILEPTTKIKINEVISLIKPIEKVKDEHVTNLLQYYELVKELKAVK